MKKIFYFIAAVPFILGSCSQEEFIENNQDLNNNSQASNVLLAGIENNATSRVGIDNTGKVTWSAGDAFTAFDANNQSATYTLATGEEGKASAKFQSDKAISPAFAFYPNLQGTTIQDDSLYVNLPNDIDVTQSQNSPMFGKIEGATVKFSQLMGLLKLNFTGLPDGYNTIKITSAKPIAGDFCIDYKNATPLLHQSTIKTDRKNAITIKNVSNGKDCYVAIPTALSEEICFSALNSANDEIQILAVANKEMAVGESHTITREYVSHKPIYKKTEFVANIDKNKIQNDFVEGGEAPKGAKGKWFGIYGKEGTSNAVGSVEALEDCIKVSVFNGKQSSFYRNCVCGYCFADAMPQTKDGNRIYKITFKYKASNKLGVTVAVRAHGGQYNNNLVKKLKYSIEKRNFTQTFKPNAVDQWETGTAYINFGLICKEDQKENSIWEESTDSTIGCFEIRFYPASNSNKLENNAYIKDLEISEAIAPSTK